MTRLAAPDPDWPHQAAALVAEWTTHVPGVLEVHHIGSTSVPGLPAKPVIDLLPVFADARAMSDAQPRIEALGYECLGEFGLPGRSYARRDHADGRREVQAHCYVRGSAEIIRHLAFRNALRDMPALRAAYASVKGACAARHPGDAHGYAACKSGWIDKTEARALERGA